MHRGGTSPRWLDPQSCEDAVHYIGQRKRKPCRAVLSYIVYRMRLQMLITGSSCTRSTNSAKFVVYEVRT